MLNEKLYFVVGIIMGYVISLSNYKIDNFENKIIFMLGMFLFVCYLYLFYQYKGE